MENTKTDPIRLDFESKRQVVVSPDDQDRFVTTEDEAANACKQAQNKKEFKEEFKSFLSFLNSWCESHSEKVESCYVSVGDASLNVLLCLRRELYDFDFEDTMVELDIDISQKFPLCVVEVLQIPKQDSLINDLPNEAIMCVYGDGKRPSETGGTSSVISG